MLRKRFSLGLGLVLAAALTLIPASSPVYAAPASGYPTALVEYMASTRTEPYLTAFGEDTYWGYALHQAPGSSARQTVSVGCWWDGDWAYGNYYTNRWFEVFVWESYDGYSAPKWLFVHASYIYNQPSVPECRSSPIGMIFLP